MVAFCYLVTLFTTIISALCVLPEQPSYFVSTLTVRTEEICQHPEGEMSERGLTPFGIKVIKIFRTFFSGYLMVKIRHTALIKGRRKKLMLMELIDVVGASLQKE